MPKRFFCPICDNLIYEDMTLEGVPDLPPADVRITCSVCAWDGQFRALKQIRAFIPEPGIYIPDFQI